MRVLIVKLSSLGDVVHTMPVVNDIRTAYPDALIDWVVEPGFAPLVRRVSGIHSSIECALRRWRKGWWTSPVRHEWREFRDAMRGERYDAIIDFQGLTKSALVARLARGTRYGLANQTEGSAYERPARWLVHHAIPVEPRIHALDRARLLAAEVFGYAVQGPPRFGLRSQMLEATERTMVLVHGSSRDDKLWPEENWIEIGRRVMASGWHIALPHAGPEEHARAQRLAAALGPACEVWPEMNIDAVTDRMGATHGVIGVDSGLSHIAVALDLPHVQIYNFPTAWRTGPLAEHGHSHQVSIEGRPAPDVDTVWNAWLRVRAAFRLAGQG
ncbi:lipopolysaccharide heptosyltransferase I [Piscinibacter sp.]|uniref:lipopolysaccharide heptosyltransferase I n=1 Tax=Piscinibacter sp. TaxID=1903157 RepID=UPI002CE5CCBB|nr:lipopolysaccharide heptosyltransferase I [Albitalea sp.]HUG21971.1 lipopolysaccharide heptosyltransferase I [Albitalea sp.]